MCSTYILNLWHLFCSIERLNTDYWVSITRMRNMYRAALTVAYVSFSQYTSKLYFCGRWIPHVIDDLVTPVLFVYQVVCFDIFANSSYFLCSLKRTTEHIYLCDRHTKYVVYGKYTSVIDNVKLFRCQMWNNASFTCMHFRDKLHSAPITSHRN